MTDVVEDTVFAVPRKLAESAQEAVRSGDYPSIEAVMSEALEIWVAQRTEKAKETAWLRRMYEEGLASGDAGPLDEDAIMAELNAEFAARKVA